MDDKYRGEYERQPKEMEGVTLAQFVARYTPTYCKRREARVIRYCSYEMKDLENYKRERVLHHVPFHSEEVDVLDSNKYVQIYDENQKQIQERAAEFESDLEIEEVIRNTHEISEERKNETEVVTTAQRSAGQAMITHLNLEDDATDDDVKTLRLSEFSGIIKKRENVLSHGEYCAHMRLTNFEQ